MVLMKSNALKQGFKAPHFELTDSKDRQTKSLTDLKGEKATLIMFICNHCPYVKLINSGLVKLANDYAQKGIKCIAISSNDATQHPEDSFENMTAHAEEESYPFPYLYDETQEVAKSYDAVCTPDFFLFNQELELTYHGQMDGASPGKDIPVTGTDLRQAMDKLLAGELPNPIQKNSIGCSIKWK